VRVTKLNQNSEVVLKDKLGITSNAAPCPTALLIDETFMMITPQLGNIEERMREVTGVKEDFGGGVAVQSVAAPFVPQAWTFVKNGLFITMNTMADGRIILTSDDESYVDGIYTKDEARITWNALLSDGWTLVSQKENA
jgi:hypothetical protein